MKAVVIDDAYARPTAADLNRSLPSLRRFLNAVPEAKQWFDANFGLTGSSRSRTYFEPLLQNPQALIDLWMRRESCPEAQRLLTEGIPDVVGEVEPLRTPLIHIENALERRGFNIQRFSALPSIDETPEDAKIIIIDYVLSPETPEDMAAKVQESTRFLKNVIERLSKNNNASWPLIILVSSRPFVANKHADKFREAVDILGAYFHFIKKVDLEGELGLFIDGFLGDYKEIELYRKVHSSISSAFADASRELSKLVNRLELQDIAALHIGHLVHEGEALSDYIGWMVGQVVSAKVQKNVVLAEAAAALPSESHRVLLGHLKPTQGIPSLFSELSSVMPASGQWQKNRRGALELRFGDIFQKDGGPEDLSKSKYLLVISQTCDILQGKIKNGQVLCVEGHATEVESSEVDLMRATLHQMDEKGSILIKSGERFYQVEWTEENLITVSQAKLKRERGYRYIGRLNEIYALEAQHNALNRLGRIGVPVKPGYGVVYGVLKVRIWGGKQEIAALARAYDTKDVVAVLRPRAKGNVAVILSAQAKMWLIDQLNALLAIQEFPTDLHDLSRKLAVSLKEDIDFHFFCKKSKAGRLQVSRLVSTTDPETNEEKREHQPLSKFSITLPAANVFGEIEPDQGVRIQLEFEPIA
jgi:hypothetical protein